METRGQQVHLDKQDARAGATPGVVRYVLIISLVLVIVALGVIWAVNASNAPANTGADADTARAVQEAHQQSPKAQP